MIKTIFNGSGIYRLVESNQDDCAHVLYRFAMSPDAFQRPNVMRVCDHCGNYLQVYYCEDKLYLVRCLHCGIAALTTAKNPDEAACKTLGG